MPDIGAFHPQIVHFVVALLLVGVVLRLVSLTGKLAWTGPAAAAMIIVGTGAAVLAVQSGTNAHGPVERVPGAREAVMEHEEWGHRTRNVFLAVAALELIALVPAVANGKAGRLLLIASGVVGIGGSAALVLAADHGGDLVYSYAGGIGIRTGDTTDVGRLLTAGLYHEARIDRTAGRGEDAARLIDELARRHPGDNTVTLMAIESMLLDRKDAAGARAALAKLSFPKDSARLRLRHGFLTADALAAEGQKDSARAVLQGMSGEFPRQQQQIDDRLKKLQ
jgi:uncharacterized membrane protein